MTIIYRVIFKPNILIQVPQNKFQRLYFQVSIFQICVAGCSNYLQSKLVMCNNIDSVIIILQRSIVVI